MIKTNQKKSSMVGIWGGGGFNKCLMIYFSFNAAASLDYISLHYGRGGSGRGEGGGVKVNLFLFLPWGGGGAGGQQRRHSHRRLCRYTFRRPETLIL